MNANMMIFFIDWNDNKLYVIQTFFSNLLMMSLKKTDESVKCMNLEHDDSHKE
jgi:hypothetical protein